MSMRIKSEFHLRASFLGCKFDKNGGVATYSVDLKFKICPTGYDSNM